MKIPNPLDLLKLKGAVFGAFILFAAGSLSGGFLTHAVDQNRYDALVISHAKADAKAAEASRKAQEAAVAAARATERATAVLAQESALRAAAADQKIVYRTNTIIKEVPTHVTAQTDARVCVPVGLVRLLDAAALGVDPADLVLPAGQSDDTCSSVRASDLARSVVGNYGIARQNAEQLDQLIADIRERMKLVNEGSEEPPQ